MINPTHFDLQTLRLFLLVADQGSLTKAAERGHLTLSAVSKRVAELERATDCALFVRHPRGLTPTAAGAELVRHARDVLLSVDRMAGHMSDYAIGVRGHIRIWANTSAVVQFLPGDLAAFLDTHAGIRISLEERLSEAVIDAVDRGEADLGIFADNVPAQGIEKYFYRQDRLVVLVPPDHPLAEHDEIDFDATLDYDFVGLNQGSSLLRRMRDAALAAERVLKLRIQVASFDAICRMIEARLGIGVLPQAAVRQELLGAGLRAIRLRDAWARRTLWLGVKRATGLLPEAYKLFEHLQHLPKDTP